MLLCRHHKQPALACAFGPLSDLSRQTGVTAAEIKSQGRISLDHRRIQALPDRRSSGSRFLVVPGLCFDNEPNRRPVFALGLQLDDDVARALIRADVIDFGADEAGPGLQSGHDFFFERSPLFRGPRDDCGLSMLSLDLLTEA